MWARVATRDDVVERASIAFLRRAGDGAGTGASSPGCPRGRVGYYPARSWHVSATKDGKFEGVPIAFSWRMMLERALAPPGDLLSERARAKVFVYTLLQGW